MRQCRIHLRLLFCARACECVCVSKMFYQSYASTCMGEMSFYAATVDIFIFRSANDAGVRESMFSTQFSIWFETNLTYMIVWQLRECYIVRAYKAYGAYEMKIIICNNNNHSVCRRHSELCAKIQDSKCRINAHLWFRLMYEFQCQNMVRFVSFAHHRSRRRCHHINVSHIPIGNLWRLTINYRVITYGPRHILCAVFDMRRQQHFAKCEILHLHMPDHWQIYVACSSQRISLHLKWPHTLYFLHVCI